MSSDSGDGAQLLALPAARGFNESQPMIHEWSVDRISFNAHHLPSDLLLLLGVQIALDEMFQAGAFPGDKSP